MSSKYKYGDKPTIIYTSEAVQALGGAATLTQVDEYLKNKLENYSDNTYSNLYALSVNNDKRSQWSFNKTPRRSDDTTHKHHKYDQLFKRGDLYEMYQPSIHGVYELYQDREGKWSVKKIKSLSQ